MHTSKHGYTTVTFDMGYTLVNLGNSYDQELIRLAAQAGVPITLDDVRAAMHRFWEEQGERDAIHTWEPSLAADEKTSLAVDSGICANLGLTDPAFHVQANAIARRIFHDPANYTVFPEVFATLEALRSMGLTLGIISNWGWYLQDLCDTLGLARHFDFIISSSRVGASKPHPAIFQAALAEARTIPAQVLHVGDSLQADVHGARGLGMTGVLLDRPRSVASANGYPVVHSLDELPDLL